MALSRVQTQLAGRAFSMIEEDSATPSSWLCLLWQKTPEDNWISLRGIAFDCGWGGRIRTCEWRLQRPLPYHLATPQQTCARLNKIEMSLKLIASGHIEPGVSISTDRIRKQDAKIESKRPASDGQSEL